jgi:type III secretion protein R
MPGDSLFHQPIAMIIFFSFLTLIPFLIITATSFVKLSAVFSIMRSALGTPQIPPNIVVTGLSLILTGVIMMPVVSEVQLRCSQNGFHWQNIQEWINGDEATEVLWTCVKEPVAAFLKKHVHDREWMMMQEMACDFNDSEQDEENICILVAAFILSELKEAFQIGFLLFLPFIVIDMIVANILQALGMVMLSPLTISLPFKLLLFVLADGWYLVVEGLLSGYL